MVLFEICIQHSKTVKTMGRISCIITVSPIIATRRLQTTIKSIDSPGYRRCSFLRNEHRRYPGLPLTLSLMILPSTFIIYRKGNFATLKIPKCSTYTINNSRLWLTANMEMHKWLLVTDHH